MNPEQIKELPVFMSLEQVKELPDTVQKTVVLNFTEEMLKSKNPAWVKYFDLCPLFRKDMLKIANKYYIEWYFIPISRTLSKDFISEFKLILSHRYKFSNFFLKSSN